MDARRDLKLTKRFNGPVSRLEFLNGRERKTATDTSSLGEGRRYKANKGMV
jgi:hypothetical protein